MKNTLLFLGLVSSMLALSSCEKNDSVPDSSCTIWINGQDKSENKSICEYRSHALTAAQVCRLNEDIMLVGATFDWVRSTGISCKINSDNENFANIDTINNRIGLTVLHVSAALYNSLFERDYQWLIILNGDTTHSDYDTVAYIPNSARLAAIDTLTSLFDASNGGWEKNYEAIDEIVQNAFKFIPCTGEEFKQIKDTDQN